MKEKSNKKNNLPLILIILDGWGIAKPNKGNAVTLAKTPNLDKLTKDYPSTQLCAHGKCVGLPVNQDGNSEAGHINMGAGRIVEQEAVRIGKSINEGTFFKNAALVEAIRHVKKNKSNLHLLGMLSDEMSAHSHPDHILALLTLAYKNDISGPYIHLFTDGRDSPKYAALKLVENLEKEFRNGESIATVMGRFYAMDRTKKWERTEAAYNAFTLGEGRKANSAKVAITESYNQGKTDEFMEPYVITKNKKPLPRIGDNDTVIFFNLRSDRARQLAKVFGQIKFNESNPNSFKRQKVPKNLKFVVMTDFGPDLDNIMTAYPGIDLKNTLPMLLPSLSQLYITETEKYAHVSYFFNGGYSGRVAGEDHFVVPSPDVKSYDETPGMKAKELAQKIIDNLSKKSSAKKYDFTVLNFPAPDMVAHSGNLEAGIKACEVIDKEVGRITGEYLKNDGTVIITADHGNIEEMINLENDEIDTKHSINPVPFIVVNKKLRQKINALEAKVLQLEGLLGECRELGTTAESGWQNKKNWRRLEVGMDETKVQSILGDPTKIIKGIQDLWYYPNIYGGYVSFDKDGKLAGWNEP